MRVVARSESRVCSFCRGDLVESQASRCAGGGCSALYHPDCWEECSSRRGSCAIMGCGSSSAWSPASRSARLSRARSADAKTPGRVATSDRSLLGHVAAQVVGAMGLLVSFIVAIGAACQLPRDYVALAGPIFFACVALTVGLAWVVQRAGDALTNAVVRARDALLRTCGSAVEGARELTERTEALSTLLYEARGRFVEAERRRRDGRRPDGRAP